MQFEPERIILGCANLGGLFLDGAKPDTERAVSIVSEAVRQGIRKFDTAPLYGWGSSEFFLGKSLEALNIARESIYISSKSLRSLYPSLERRDETQPDFWTLGEPNCRFTHRWGVDYESVLQTTLRTLEMIRSSRLDGLSFHDIADAMAEDPTVTWDKLDEAIRACKALQSSGFVGEIGFGGKESETLVTLMKRHQGLLGYASTTTYNLLDQGFLTSGALEECSRNGLEYRVAGPFASRLLAEDPRKAVRRPGKDGITRWYYADDPNMPVTFNYRYISDTDYNRACRVWQLAERFGEPSPRALAIQFVLKNPKVAAVIIGASTPDHLLDLRENIERELDPQVWSALRDEEIISPESPI